MKKPNKFNDMKNLLILMTMLLALSCNYSAHTYESKTMIQEEVVAIVDFNSTKEAIRVQKRLDKHCSKPRRLRTALFLTKEHLECKRKLFGKEYGIIREKYRAQIDNQIK